MKKQHITGLSRLSPPPLPTRPQDEPLWISFAGCLSLGFLFYMTWLWS